MKTTKYRLILPVQAKGNVGKSLETAARACWLNQRGIHWQGFDLDGDNRTLSRLFHGQTKLVPLNGQPDDLDELISILRKATAAPVTLVDPRAHLDGQLMKALHATHLFEIANAQSIGITVMVFPLDDLDVGDTKVFLGIVHHTDGIDDFRRRRDLARKHLASFGIGSVCGYGRVEPEKLPEILRTHAQDAEEL